MTEIFAEILQWGEGLEQRAYMVTMVRLLWGGRPSLILQKKQTPWKYDGNYNHIKPSPLKQGNV